MTVSSIEKKLFAKELTKSVSPRIERSKREMTVPVTWLS